MDPINVDKEIPPNNEENTIEKEVEGEGEDIALKPQKNNKQNPKLYKKKKKENSEFYYNFYINNHFNNFYLFPNIIYSRFFKHKT